MTGLAAVTFVLLIVQLMLLCCFYDKIRVAIMILKGSSEFSFTHAYSLLVPAIILVLVFATAAVCVGTIVFAYSSG